MVSKLHHLLRRPTRFIVPVRRLSEFQSLRIYKNLNHLICRPPPSHLSSLGLRLFATKNNPPPHNTPNSKVSAGAKLEPTQPYRIRKYDNSEIIPGSDAIGMRLRRKLSKKRSLIKQRALLRSPPSSASSKKDTLVRLAAQTLPCPVHDAAANAAAIAAAIRTDVVAKQKPAVVSNAKHAATVVAVKTNVEQSAAVPSTNYKSKTTNLSNTKIDDKVVAAKRKVDNKQQQITANEEDEEDEDIKLMAVDMPAASKRIMTTHPKYEEPAVVVEAAITEIAATKPSARLMKSEDLIAEGKHEHKAASQDDRLQPSDMPKLHTIIGETIKPAQKDTHDDSVAKIAKPFIRTPREYVVPTHERKTSPPNPRRITYSNSAYTKISPIMEAGPAPTSEHGKFSHEKKTADPPKAINRRVVPPLEISPEDTPNMFAPPSTTSRPNVDSSSYLRNHLRSQTEVTTENSLHTWKQREEILVRKHFSIAPTTNRPAATRKTPLAQLPFELPKPKHQFRDGQSIEVPAPIPTPVPAPVATPVATPVPAPVLTNRKLPPMNDSQCVMREHITVEYLNVLDAARPLAQPENEIRPIEHIVSDPGPALHSHQTYNETPGVHHNHSVSMAGLPPKQFGTRTLNGETIGPDEPQPMGSSSSSSGGKTGSAISTAVAAGSSSCAAPKATCGPPKPASSCNRCGETTPTGCGAAAPKPALSCGAPAPKPALSCGAPPKKAESSCAAPKPEASCSPPKPAASPCGPPKPAASSCGPPKPAAPACGAQPKAESLCGPPKPPAASACSPPKPVAPPPPKPGSACAAPKTEAPACSPPKPARSCTPKPFAPCGAAQGSTCAPAKSKCAPPKTEAPPPPPPSCGEKKPACDAAAAKPKSICDEAPTCPPPRSQTAALAVDTSTAACQLCETFAKPTPGTVLSQDDDVKIRSICDVLVCKSSKCGKYPSNGEGSASSTPSPFPAIHHPITNQTPGGPPSTPGASGPKPSSEAAAAVVASSQKLLLHLLHQQEDAHHHPPSIAIEMAKSKCDKFQPKPNACGRVPGDCAPRTAKDCPPIPKPGNVCGHPVPVPPKICPDPPPFVPKVVVPPLPSCENIAPKKPRRDCNDNKKDASGSTMSAIGSAQKALKELDDILLAQSQNHVRPNLRYLGVNASAASRPAQPAPSSTGQQVYLNK